MWKWVRTVIPYERREQRAAKHVTVCYTAMKKGERSEREEGMRRKQRDSDKEKEKEREKRRRNWEKTMMEQKGGD